MCLRIILYYYFTYLLISYLSNQFVDGSLVRPARSESHESSDNSKSFNDAFQDFLSNLFGSKSNETEVTDKPLSDNLGKTTTAYLANVSEIAPALNGTSTNTITDLNRVTNTSLTNYTYSLTNSTQSLTNSTQLLTNSTQLLTNSTQFPVNYTQSPVNATSGPESLNSSTEATSPAFEIATSQRPEKSRCYYDTHFKYYCVLPAGMTDAAFRDVYSLFFSDSVVDALKTACPRGSWCLQDSGGNWESLISGMVDSATSSLLSMNMCTPSFQTCMTNMISNFVECSSYQQMQMTADTMQLICGLKEDSNLSADCYLEVLKSLHVSLADVLRQGDNPEIEVATCQSPEAHMAQRLICVEVACPRESRRFHSFTPWAWFTSVEDDIMIECKLNPSSCQSTQQSGTPATGNNITTASKQEEHKTATSTTTETVSSSSSWVTSSTSWPQSSTSYPLEEDKCYTDAVFQNFCPVPNDMTDVSFWDLYSVFFSDSVIDALMIGCTKGVWCLKDKFDYWQSLIVERVDMVMHSEISESMCNQALETCVDRVVNNFKNCTMYPQMVYTSEVLKLICDMKQNARLESQCYMHVISALHVTLADILRTNPNAEPSDDNCESPEAHMTKGLICVENSCPDQSTTFHSFKPWAWFTSVVNDLIDECNYDPTKCMALLQRPAGYGSEMGTLVGISVATMVTALTLTVVVCTCYKRHRRNAVVKEGYQRLLTDGDES